MQTFKLKPKPRSDYRLEIKEIKKKCKIEEYGFRHNKVVYGFCVGLPDLAELQSLGLNIEEITFDKVQLNLKNNLVERGLVKSKIEHLEKEQDKYGVENELQKTIVYQKLTDLNNKIQAAKETLSIIGTLKVLKF